MEKLREPFILHEHAINITTSIGISFYPEYGLTVNDLLTKADIALSNAKSKGRNLFQFYTPDMNAATLERIELENDLQQAVKNKEFILHYQPIFDIKSLKMTGFEALIRWQHPQRGLTMPDQFIPLAEETSIIREIGSWVLSTACQQMKAWQDQGYPDLRIAVNLSKQQINQGGFFEHVNDILSTTQLPPEFLELELTENAIFNQSEEIISTINALRNKQIRICIDDFGIGYSSLNYLKTIPVDVIKIDRSFIQDICHNVKDRSIVYALAKFGNSLDIAILAEGIETLRQLAILRKLGCDYGQGYCLARPMTAEQCGEFLRNHRVKKKRFKPSPGD